MCAHVYGEGQRAVSFYILSIVCSRSFTSLKISKQSKEHQKTAAPVIFQVHCVHVYYLQWPAAVYFHAGHGPRTSGLIGMCSVSEP